MKKHVKSDSLSVDVINKYRQAVKTLCEEWNYHPSFISSLRNIIEVALSHYNDTISPNEKTYLILSFFMEIKKELKIRGSFSIQKKEIEKLLEGYLCKIPFHFTTQEDFIFLQKANAEFPQVESLKVSKQIPSFTFDIKNDIEVWLSNWMIRPHFAMYKDYYEHIEYKEAKFFLVDRVIEELQKQIAHRPVRRTLFQLLSYHHRYEQGIELWSLSPCDPSMLSMEEQQFFKLIRKNNSHLAIPLYMHWIERLIEKKTKKHYESSVVLLKDLQAILGDLDCPEQFQLFLFVLQKRYKGFAALQKELKQFDSRSR
ncbi:hypothetical protein [Salipaludibacillus sp. CF4.18]|uniref:hypothetical protein n=1 Tax=Salipaludibacillus sp. CF4.18 TaxID=3373081 RepID=UPI003EE5F8B5